MIDDWKKELKECLRVLEEDVTEEELVKYKGMSIEQVIKELQQKVNASADYIANDAIMNSALSSTEEDNLQDEYDLHDYREQQAQDNGGYPEKQ
jgi:glutamate/tyrosine decarboxylase-like PLP-dependent enzyme